MNDYITKTDNFMAQLVRSGVRVARVGGSVRDEILGRRVKDADYVVFGLDLVSIGTALREVRPKVEVSPLKLRDGRQAGWRVSGKGLGAIEIALPRKEISTGDGHRDFKIVLDPNLTAAEDAVRRDFTFNALYKWIDPETTTSEAHAFAHGSVVLANVEDPTGRGLYDLQRRLVSTTHPDSFRDDPLRILRALRFVSVLGYDLRTQTQRQMIDHADAVSGLNFQGNTSGTVLAEMDKLLMGDDVGKALRLMRYTGVMAHLFPELAPMIGHDPNSKYHDLPTDEHTIRAIEAAGKVNAPLTVRWALLFHDSGKPEVEWVGADGRKHYYSTVLRHDNGDEIMTTEDHEIASERRWLAFCDRANAPKGLRDTVATLIREHMVTVQPRNMGVKVRRMRVKFGDQMTHDLLLHRSCDLMGKNKTSLASIGHITDQERARVAAVAENVPTSSKDLEINGHDVAGFGMRGRAIGAVLAAVLDEVVCQPDDLRRSKAWQMEAAVRHARRFA